MICVSVLPATVEEARRLRVEAAGAAGVVEVRLDRLRGGIPADFWHAGPGRLVVTNRRRDEGGCFTGTEEERIAPLIAAAEAGVDYVDVELRTPRALREALSAAVERGGRRTRLIISHHDLAGTPPAATLAGRYRACRDAGADVIKIVTRAETAADGLRVLSLIPRGRREGREVVAFAMGEAGRMSRVYGALLGSPLTYCRLDTAGPTAPGQFGVGEMTRLLAVLGEDEDG